MRKTLSILALLLLVSILTFSALPSANALRHAPITVDGNPSDWTGTPPATDNTWKYDDAAGEWIWRDMVGDDKGNGTYTYPTARIVVGGVNRTAFSSGDFDLTELRIAWNETYVFFLLTFVNLTDNDWVADLPGWVSSPIIAETTAVAICIDTDRADNSGFDIVDTTTDMLGSVRADIALPSSCYWEYMLEIALEDVVLWRYDAGTMAVVEATRNFPGMFAAADPTTYKTIEFAVKIDAAGIEGLPDPEGQTWALFAFVGSQDYQHFREIASAEVASTNIWAAGGGEGNGGADDIGYDPDAFDCAFFTTKAAQEAALNGFTVEPPDFAVISAYKEIPEFPLTFGFALIAIVVLAASFKLRKKLYL